jgi:hypothetical protein
MYIILNECYGTSEYSLDFCKELFNKYPPTDLQLEKHLYKKQYIECESEGEGEGEGECEYTITVETETKNDGSTKDVCKIKKDVKKREIFNDKYDLINYKPKKPWFIIQNKETKLYYHISQFHQDISDMFQKNNEGFDMVEYLMKRYDGNENINNIIIKDSKFTDYFYKIIIPKLGWYKFHCSKEEFEENTVNISPTIIIGDIDNEKYTISVFNNSYCMLDNPTRNTQLFYYKLPFDESNWKTSGIASNIYFHNILQNNSHLSIVELSDDMDFELREYDGQESINIKLPYEKIIEELLKHIELMDTFIEPIMNCRGELAKASDIAQPNMSKLTKALLNGEKKVNELYKAFAVYKEL